ncbi:MAG TPA: helix-turn-helix domain-containing protein [Steroidobacteraceae bacterium]
MYGIVHFNADSVAPRDRLAVWGEQIWSKLGGLETSLIDSQPFRASVHAGQMGSVQVCRIAVGAHRIRRTPQLIRQSDPSLLKLVYQVRGQACLEQLGERVILKPGQWCLYDGSRPYTLFNYEDVEQIALLVPRRELTSARLQTKRNLMAPFPATSGMSRILYQCLHSTVNELEVLPSHQVVELGESLTEFARLTLRERVEGASRASNRALTRERIKHFIRCHAGDSTLSIDTIARTFNCTKRYLHKIFDDESNTLSRFIWQTRLERCEQDLINRELAGRSITEIAFAWGFVNSAHFSRAFRRHYGVSPRVYRSMHMRGNKE